MLLWIKWSGKSRDGKKHQGMLEAVDKDAARAWLHQQGILVTKLGSRPFSRYFASSIPATAILAFYQQLAWLLKASLSLSKAVEILHREQNRKALKNLLFVLKKDIDKGLSLATALSKHDAYFSPSLCALVQAGEASGQLSDILENIAKTLEKTALLKKNLQKALTWPAIVLMTAMLVGYGLLIFIIPQFQSLFQSFNTELPFLTRLLIKTSDLFRQSSPFLIVSLVFAASAAIYLKNTSKPLRLWFDNLLLKLPLTSTLLKKAAIARFISTLGLALKAGLPLRDALKMVSSIHANRRFNLAIEQTHAGVSQGLPLHLSLRNTGLFPTLVTELVALAEETGSLDATCVEIHNILEKNLDESFEKITQRLEPLLLFGVGLFVAFLVIALYLPVFKLGSAL